MGKDQRGGKPEQGGRPEQGKERKGRPEGERPEAE